MEIRQFRNGDAPGVKRLIISILNKEFSKERSAYPNTDLDAILKVYGGDRECFYVIEDNGDIVATVGVKEDSKYIALLRRLFVDPRYRGKGYGSRLVDKAFEFCKQKGYHQMVFRSTDRMASANRLCFKKGFVEEDRFNLGDVEIVKFTRKL